MCSQARREAGDAVSGGYHVDESTRGLVMEAMGRNGERAIASDAATAQGRCLAAVARVCTLHGDVA